MKLFFREYGVGHPLIILHGLLGLSDNWLTVAKAFSEEYRVILPDLRNHGQSPHDSVHTYDAISDDINELISDLSLVNVSIIGHSMGGKAAMVLADKYPGMIKKLAVIDISPLAYEKRNINELEANHFELLDFMNDFDISKMKNRNDIAEITKERFNNQFVTQLILKNVKRNTERKFVWKINTNILRNNLSEIGKELSFSEKNNMIDAMFLFGKKSPFFSEKDYYSVKRNFPNSLIKVVDGAGHNIHIDNKAGLIKEIKQFLR